MDELALPIGIFPPVRHLYIEVFCCTFLRSLITGHGENWQTKVRWYTFHIINSISARNPLHTKQFYMITCWAIIRLLWSPYKIFILSVEVYGGNVIELRKGIWRLINQVHEAATCRFHQSCQPSVPLGCDENAAPKEARSTLNENALETSSA